jgi:HAD superfamily hydrolase (TIGR01459 family)
MAATGRVPDMTTPIPYLPGIADLVSGYDGFVLDLWGVIHDGVGLYPGAADALGRLAAAGKRFVMLTNAPRRAAAVSEQMAAMGLPEALCRPVVSSGEATWRELRSRSDPWFAGLGGRCHHIGPARDENLFDGLDVDRVTALDHADFILNTGPWRDDERVEDYEDRLAEGARLGIPMICANPDLQVIRGGKRIICAGALARRYEALGGTVRYLGKPYASIYAYCFEHLGGAARGRVLAIGDSLGTDIAGAAAAGIDAALVVGGIHAGELGVADGAPPDADDLARLCARAGLSPVAAVPGFVW